MNMKFGVLAGSALVMMSGLAMGTELTFTIDGIGNFDGMPDDYGDRVVMLDDGIFHYDEHGEGFTPNIEVDYPNTNGISPSWWGTGYGDLVGIYFENADGNGQGEIVLTADYGYEVVLYGFDMSAYSNAFSSDPTINAVRVMGCSDTPLFEELDAVISETTHTSYDFAQPLRAREIRIQFDTANLGNLSDDIAFDNILFGQSSVGVEEIPCYADYAAPACVLNFLDVSAFLGYYSDGDPRGDINQDGSFNFLDVSDFLQDYGLGCDVD